MGVVLLSSMTSLYSTTAVSITASTNSLDILSKNFISLANVNLAILSYVYC